MHLWHLTLDTAPRARHVAPGARIAIPLGTWPVEPAQAVWLAVRTERANGEVDEGRVDAVWQRNVEQDSHWVAELGPFVEGTRASYTLHGYSPDGEVVAPGGTLVVGPRLHVALLWHQHQPLYRDLAHPTPRGSYAQPWVRLHALRDYYGMAALVAEHPDVHVTINFTPILLWQLADYAERGATDRALELTRTPARALTTAEREEILSTFFDADWHHQIFPHARYAELFVARQTRRPFTLQEIRDLQMWSTLAWFAKEFREGDVTLPTGEVASVRRFVAKQREFSQADITAMVTEQYKILRAIVPLHRALQDRGQIEVATTPFAHPILPLLVDSDRATIDRPGATHPPRFAWPEDADAQVRLAVAAYEDGLGRASRGMWPAEGAVAQYVVPHFARHGVRWIATDRGVLARSGLWGYDADNPNVACQPYRAVDSDDAGAALSVFFRDAWLSDRLGFDYQREPDAGAAARDFIVQIKRRITDRLDGTEDRVLTVILDGENAWGAYAEDGRPFLRALYAELAADPELRTVTFGEYLDGNPSRGVRAHPLGGQPVVHDLFAGSWIDEAGSAPGVDLGTWIGEDEENRAWALLGSVRDDLARRGATPATAPEAFHALYAAEGSDWFWWFGDDQESGHDDVFDDLFRTHLRSVYTLLGVEPSAAIAAALAEHIVPHVATWTFTQPVDVIRPGDRMHVVTNCPGELTWWVDEAPPHTAKTHPAGGVMAGPQRHYCTLGPFARDARALRFRFLCKHHACHGRGDCCRAGEQLVWFGAVGSHSALEPSAREPSALLSETIGSRVGSTLGNTSGGSPATASVADAPTAHGAELRRVRRRPAPPS